MILIFGIGCEEDNLRNPLKICEAPNRDCWDWSCDGSGCQAIFTDEIERVPQCSEYQIRYVTDRFFSVCISCVDTSQVSHYCRPALCDDTAGCPQFEGVAYECVNGICQNDDVQTYSRNGITGKGAITVCMGAVKRSETQGGANDPAAIQITDDVMGICKNYSDQCQGDLPDSCLAY